MLNNGELDKVFKALSDATRRAMVERLVRGPVSVSQLAEPFAMSLPAVHQHLAVLEDAGIVTSHKIGRVRTVQLATDALTGAGEWMGRQRLPAERRLDRLGTYLAIHERTLTMTTETVPAPSPTRPSSSSARSTPRSTASGTRSPSPSSTPSGSASDPGFTPTEEHEDFRVGGQAVQDGQWHGGPTSRYVATYTDIVERSRIVSTYDMWVGGEHLSTSLQLDRARGGRRRHPRHLHRAGVFLDGKEDGSQREDGFRGIFDALATYLAG